MASLVNRSRCETGFSRPAVPATSKNVRCELIERRQSIALGGKLTGPGKALAHPWTYPHVNRKAGHACRANEHVEDLALAGGKFQEVCEQH